MTASSPQEVSGLLRAWRGGYMVRERPGHTLQTSALVNEAFIRLIDVKNIEWQDRSHFFAISANLMRQILVDIARKHKCDKRSGNFRQVSLEKALLIPSAPDPDLVKLDEALSALAQLDPRKARVVELKFFGGLKLNEIAEVLEVSRDTIKSDWRFAKTWLLSEMEDREKDEAGTLSGT